MTGIGCRLNMRVRYLARVICLPFPVANTGVSGRRIGTNPPTGR